MKKHIINCYQYYYYFRITSYNFLIINKELNYYEFNLFLIINYYYSKKNYGKN